MLKKPFKFQIGLRTLKTAVAVIIAMLIVDSYGATTSKLIFAMLGAMAAMRPTFRESAEACMTQIIGVLFGAVIGVLLLYLPIPRLAVAGVGIVLVITLYNALHIHFAPDLPCLIVVTLCTATDIQPFAYALGRIWDSAIGLSVGFLINMLVFPYDNSRQIRETVKSLDKELLRFLEEMFDGDNVLPNARNLTATVDDMDRQLKMFSKQKLFLHRKRQNKDLETFRLCEGKARELVARMVVLSRMEHPGKLDEENRRLLAESGAQIRDAEPAEEITERDIVTNYHVRQILSLRTELLEALGK